MPIHVAFQPDIPFKISFTGDIEKNVVPTVIYMDIEANINIMYQIWRGRGD